MISPEATSTPERDEPQPGAPRAQARSAWPRLAPLILVAGLLAGASILLPHLPKEREIELRLDDAATVVGLDLAWTETSPGGRQGDGASFQGNSWRFAPGTAPRSLRTTVRLPDGAYGVDITVERTLGLNSTRRSIDLGGADRITLSVR